MYRTSSPGRRPASPIDTPFSDAARRRTVPLAMVLVWLAACADLPDSSDLHTTDATQAEATHVPVTLTLEWRSTSYDILIDIFLPLPEALDLLAARVAICSPSPIKPCALSLDHDGAPITLDCGGLSATCFDLGNLPPGGTITATWTNGDVQTLVVPPRPQAGVYANTTLVTADGTAWFATPTQGLFGVITTGPDLAGPTAASIHYPGVKTSDDWDPVAERPQSNFIADLAHAGERALWVATLTTGVSWFDPGPDPMSRDDDTWLHGQPFEGAYLTTELAQTPTAIAPDPTNANGLWVATLNGVYHARKTVDGIDFVRYADGPALAIAVDASHHVWVGFSTQLAFFERDDDNNTIAVPTAEAALLVIAPGADPHVPDDASLRWSVPDEHAITALLPDDAGGAWVGTPYGLGHVDTELELSVVSVPVLDTFAVVDFARTDKGMWVSARSECEADGALVHIELAEPWVVVDHSAGFAERSFASLTALPSGDLIVATLAAVPIGIGGSAPLTAAGCELPTPTSADVYVREVDGSTRPLLR